MRLGSLSLIALLSACAGGTGQLELGLTASSQLAATNADDPAAEAPRLVVTVERVDVHIGDGDDADEAGEDAGDGSAGWITIHTGPTEIDLRDAASSEVFLGSETVPVGRVTQVRLILAADPVLVTGDTEQTIACPSCTQTGIKLVTRGGLAVTEDQVLDLNLVFDTVASVAATLEGPRMTPVIRLEKDPTPEPTE